jgi:hypothetical protein
MPFFIGNASFCCPSLVPWSLFNPTVRKALTT